MQIEKVRVEGFRLLQDVEIMLEANSTVIVGRNNSGKTSLTDVFDRFFGETGARFRLEDFSAASRSKFFDAKALREKKASPEEILAALPKIVLTLTLAYDSAASSLGPLAPFVIDLDVASTIDTFTDPFFAANILPIVISFIHSCYESQVKFIMGGGCDARQIRLGLSVFQKNTNITQ